MGEEVSQMIQNFWTSFMDDHFVVLNFVLGESLRTTKYAISNLTLKILILSIKNIFSFSFTEITYPFQP